MDEHEAMGCIQAEKEELAFLYEDYGRIIRKHLIELETGSFSSSSIRQVSDILSSIRETNDNIAKMEKIMTLYSTIEVSNACYSFCRDIYPLKLVIEYYNITKTRLISITHKVEYKTTKYIIPTKENAAKHLESKCTMYLFSLLEKGIFGGAIKIHAHLFPAPTSRGSNS
ncbi:MAG: hypothetical protein WCP21_09635 [Armatimonadota bacterium]